MSWLTDDIWTTATRSDRAKAEQVNRLESCSNSPGPKSLIWNMSGYFKKAMAKGLLDYLRRQRDAGS